MHSFSKASNSSLPLQPTIQDTQKQRKIKIATKKQIKGNKNKNNTSNRPSNKGLDIDGDITFDKDEVASKFKSLFSSVASRLVLKLAPSLKSYGDMT